MRFRATCIYGYSSFSRRTLCWPDITTPTIATPSDQRPSYSSNRMIALDQNYEGPRSNISFVDFLHRQVARGLAADFANREPNQIPRIRSYPCPSAFVMKVGDWIILAVSLGMLSATLWIAYDIWKTTADVPISENGYIALGVGAALSLSVGCGLMALLFYRRRHE